jgi:hypothetical protein
MALGHIAVLVAHCSLSWPVLQHRKKEESRMSLIRNQSNRAARILGVCLAWMAMAVVALAQTISTTVVQGTVYLANGSPGSGTLQLSWPAFTTATNQAVAAGKITTNIGTDGSVSVNLAPNLGASPAGLYYTAIYHMSDGTTSTEYRRIEPAQLLRVFGGPDFQSAARFVSGDRWSMTDANDERIRSAGFKRSESTENSDEGVNG